MAPKDVTRRLLLAYYGATALFLILDYVAGWNIRLAFLDSLPAARAAYYGVCLFCLGLMLWRPDWTELVGAFESLVTLAALIVSIWVRTVVISDEMIETGAGFITLEEVYNFIIAGGAAYIAWFRGIRRLTGSKSH